jgi:hypothetical protein
LTRQKEKEEFMDASELRYAGTEGELFPKASQQPRVNLDRSTHTEIIACIDGIRKLTKKFPEVSLVGGKVYGKG